MAVATQDLTDFVNKRVTLIHNLATPNEKGETAEELEGTLVAVAGDAVMFKPKGKTNALLIDLGEVERVDFAQEKAKTLPRKTLKPVTHGQARAHLLERHGFALAAINGMGETEAFKLHADMDHVELDLGHVHGEKESKDEAGEADTDD